MADTLTLLRLCGGDGPGGNIDGEDPDNDCDGCGGDDGNYGGDGNPGRGDCDNLMREAMVVILMVAAMMRRMVVT